jgi:hypothetical protein
MEMSELVEEPSTAFVLDKSLIAPRHISRESCLRYDTWLISVAQLLRRGEFDLFLVMNAMTDLDNARHAENRYVPQLHVDV